MEDKAGAFWDQMVSGWGGCGLWHISVWRRYSWLGEGIIRRELGIERCGKRWAMRFAPCLFGPLVAGYTGQVVKLLYCHGKAIRKDARDSWYC